MRRKRTASVIVRAVPLVAMALAAGVVAGGLNAVHSSHPPTRSPQLASAVGAAGDKPYGVGAAPFAHRPSTSCAASACHGGGAIGKAGSEHSTWTREAAPSATGDPHAKAYSVLFNPVSVRMGQLLGFDGKKEPLPHENTRCLVCHSVAEGAGGGDDREQFLAEGVGCGGCHGPADKWIAEHTLPSWKARSNESKWKDFGFVPTKNLVARTLNCASCHVGDGTRDMNHDFIAAGHPRLAFEPARFHAQPDYRKHWTEKAPARDFEVRVWVVGQAATLRAAVNLLYERARKAETPNVSHPWPEFSGYSCFSCHQTIGGDALRGERSATARPVGNPPWEVWANAGAGVAAETCGTAFPGVSSPQLLKVQELRKLMGAKREPNPAEVARLALAARDELDQWLAQLQAAEDRELVPVPEGTPRRIAHLLTSRALNGDKLADHDWDALASTYLGAASMWTATGGRGGREALWGEPLARVYGALKFPPGSNGPVKFGKPELDTIYKQLELLRDTTGTPEGK